MEQITTVGIDLAKNVFSLHGVDGAGRTVLPAPPAGTHLATKPLVARRDRPVIAGATTAEVFRPLLIAQAQPDW